MNNNMSKAATAAPNPVNAGANCGSKDCPKHGTNAAMRTTQKSAPAMAPVHDRNNCKDKHCPRHGNMAAKYAMQKPASTMAPVHDHDRNNCKVKNCPWHGSTAATNAMQKPVSAMAPVHDRNNCKDKNCPRHGTMAAAMQKPTSAPIHDRNNCKDKDCPKHGQMVAGSANTFRGAVRINNLGSAGDAVSGRKSEATTTKVQPLNDKEIDDFFNRVQQTLRVSMPASKPGVPNNVMTFITNNHNLSDGSINSRSPTPVLSPKKERISNSGTTGMYDQMRMEHVLKENVVLQSISMKQKEEIAQFEDQLREAAAKLKEAQIENTKLKAKMKGFVKITEDWSNALQGKDETIKNLKSKLNYTELKAKQLKRMASDNATIASKWRTKVMESLQAQKEMEEKKNESEKAALGIYKRLRDEKKKVVNLKRHHGAAINESDLLDITVSSTADSLDASLIQSPTETDIRHSPISTAATMGT